MFCYFFSVKFIKMLIVIVCEELEYFEKVNQWLECCNILLVFLNVFFYGVVLNS